MTSQEKIDHHIKEIIPYLEQVPGVSIIHAIHPHRVLHMNSTGLKLLGIQLDELKTMGMDYYERFFNPDDAAEYVPTVLGLLERNNDDETVSFFQQVRNSEAAPWSWYLSGSRIFLKDDAGLPMLTITIAIPIDKDHFYQAKIERLLAENTFLRRNQHRFIQLSKRQKQILTLMAKDQKSQEIAKALFLSEETVKTHRRNIKKKLGIQNQYELMQFAQSFDLV